MDDRNQTIQYLPAGRWEEFNCSLCFDQTGTYNPYGCNTSDNCHLTIPFTGSGITLYMMLLYITNFTVSIDGSTPNRSTFIPSQNAAVYNFVAFDQQFLQFGQHSLDLVQLDTNETGDSANNSNFLFDYAMINDTNPFPNDTASSTSVSQPPTSSPSVSHSNNGAIAGAIAGGIVGGLIVLLCLYYLVLLCRRRARSTMSDWPPESNLIGADTLPTPYLVDPFDAQWKLQGTPTDNPATTSMQHPSATIPMSTSSLSPNKSTASGGSSLPIPASAGTSAELPSLLSPSSLPLHVESTLAPAIATLSADQLNLLHRLAESNAPGPVLTTVAQSMALGSQGRSHLEPVDIAPPPEYSPYSPAAD